MPAQFLESIKTIERQYLTGEEPVLVMCSDMNAYVCKYMRSSATAYKLACEVIGTQFADVWRLGTPESAFVRIKPEHWGRHSLSHNLSAPAFGSKWLDGVVDITPSTFGEISQVLPTLLLLMRIALFDFWIANEDRNANNANLLYDIPRGMLVPIDYGCILNTATFEYPMAQLTSTDTILYSDLFHHLAYGVSGAFFIKATNELNASYKENVKGSVREVKHIIEAIPHQWNISTDVLKNKLNQLFEPSWIESVWENFMECLNENTSHG